MKIIVSNCRMLTSTITHLRSVDVTSLLNIDSGVIYYSIKCFPLNDFDVKEHFRLNGFHILLSYIDIRDSYLSLISNFRKIEFLNKEEEFYLKLKVSNEPFIF